MDYEFIQDSFGEITTKFSMGHEAIGYWLYDEIKDDLKIIFLLIHIANDKIKQQSLDYYQLSGHHYYLRLNCDETIIQQKQFADLDISLEQGMHYDDNDKQASCGTIDFLTMLEHYATFISESKMQY